MVGDGCVICRAPKIADEVCARCRETLEFAEASYERLDSHTHSDSLESYRAEPSAAGSSLYEEFAETPRGKEALAEAERYWAAKSTPSSYLRFCASQWVGAVLAVSMGVLTYVQARWHDRWAL